MITGAAIMIENLFRIGLIEYLLMSVKDICRIIASMKKSTAH